MNSYMTILCSVAPQACFIYSLAEGSLHTTVAVVVGGSLVIYLIEGYQKWTLWKSQKSS